MMKCFRIIHFLLFVPLLTAVSCSCEKEEMTVGRVVLLYLEGNNDLVSYARQNISSINYGFLPDYYSAGDGDVFLMYCHLKGSKPYLVRMSKTSSGKVRSDTLVRYQNHDSCDPAVLKNVMDYTFKEYPGRERGLILWSHGSGWLPEGYYADPVEFSSLSFGTVSPGETSGAPLVHIPLPEDPYSHLVKSFGVDDGYDSEMDIVEMGETLAGQQLDYVIFDCCLMGGVEVAYQIRDKCDYVVASQAEILANGFPYESLIGTLFADSLSVHDRIVRAAGEYYEYYRYESATVSALRTDALESLALSVKAVMDAGGRESTQEIPIDRDGEITSIQRYFRMNRHWFYDLDDYIGHICEDQGLYSAFESALSSAVIYKAATPYFLRTGGGFAITHHSGLSTFIDRPKSKYLETYYKSLDWCGDSGMLE